MNEEKLMKKQAKATNGITLIALVVTIIVLLILAGVAINLSIGQNGIFSRAQHAANTWRNAETNEQLAMDEMGDYIDDVLRSEEGFDGNVNKPQLTSGMIPVYYDEENKVWKKADENNSDNLWYNYEEKKWANIVTVAEEDKELRDAEVGTEIPMDKITTFFVWIPRYAYSIESGYKKGNTGSGKINVVFLKGNTNKDKDDTKYEEDYDETKIEEGGVTPMIVHPAFTNGNNNLKGIWVAKFEASGINASGETVGNASSTSSSTNSTTGAYVRILPSQVSWRHITIGESEYQSMQMGENSSKYGWTNSVNSHLIKNSEWGAVAYLCYSDYGSIPMTNGSGTYSSGGYYYDMYTGAGPKATNNEGRYENFTEETYGYNTSLGVLSSTTGNVYGIYDMAGGAWERVASYLDNGNGNLNTYGKSSSNSNVKYFENGILNSQYTAYWEKYEVSSEEKENKIQVGSSTINQGTLWNWANKGIEYNEARKRLTEANFNNMFKYKGIGVNETTKTFSYYAPFGTTGSGWGWFTTVKDTATNTTQEYGGTWNNDYTLIGHASKPFVVRGGDCGNGSDAGVLASSVTYGSALINYGFRPVLAF